MSTVRASLRRRAQSVPLIVWAATAVFTALLGAWSVLVPLYEGPDEPNHLDLVMLLADGGDYPDYNTRQASVAIMRDCHDFAVTQRWCPVPDREAPTSRARRDGPDAPDKGTGATYRDLGGDQPSARPNQLAQHPPLYYRAMAVVVKAQRAVLPGDSPLARELALLRLVNVALMVPVPWLTWTAARRLGLGRRPAELAALLPLAIPQFTHIGSTVSNDNLLVLLAAVATALSAGVIRGDRSWPTAAALAVTGSAAMLTKASGVAVLVMIGVSYAVGWWDLAPTQRRAELRCRVLRLGAVALAVLVLAGWWYIRNRLRHGTFTPSIDTESIDERLQPPGFTPSARDWSERFLEWMPSRFFGWFGWFSARATYRLLVFASLFSGLLVALGLTAPRTDDGGDRAGSGDTDDGTSPARRIHLLALFAIGPVLLVTVVVRAWGLYERSGQFPFLQGRYLFPAVMAGAVVAAAGAHRLFGRWAAPVLVAWALVMQVDGIRTALRTYWGPVDGSLADQLSSAVAWSRWPGELVGLGALLALGAVLALVVAVVVDLRRSAVTNP